MTRGRTFSLLTAIVLLASVSVNAQSPDRGRSRRGTPGSPGPSGPRPGGPGRDRGDFVGRIADMYDLTAEEREAVRVKLDELRAQREADPQHAEIHKAGEELRQLSEQQRRGQPVDERRMNALRDQLRQGFSRSRAGWDQMMEQVESVIPPEKVQKGRERRQQWQQRFQQQRPQPPQETQPEAPPPPPAPQMDGSSAADGGSDVSGDARSRRYRSSRDHSSDGHSPRDRSSRERGSHDGRADRGDRDSAGRERGSRDGEEAVVDMRDDWQRYVDDFCDRYKLNDGQRATARTILRECIERRDKIQQQSRDEFTKLADIDDAKERAEKMRELKKPIDVVFQELKDRLDQIPTTTQRLEAPQPTSAPATRPSSGRRSRRG